LSALTDAHTTVLADSKRALVRPLTASCALSVARHNGAV
jgi:hypothetical protein